MSNPLNMLSQLQGWVGAAHDVVIHIGSTRGPLASYYHFRQESSPWPIDATDILKRDTQAVQKYLENRHALDLKVALNRIRTTACLWIEKRPRFDQFSRIRHPDQDTAVAAMEELSRFSEEGLPEQRRLNLDNQISQGALWRASFPLLAEHEGREDPFIVRRNLVRWAIWVQEAFREVIRDWPLPCVPDSDPVGGRDATGGWLESQERWELAGVISPRYVPNTDETPVKLAIAESRRVGDLVLALPLIKKVDEEIVALVHEAVEWQYADMQPARTELLLQAISDLDELTGTGKQYLDNGASNRRSGEETIHGPDFRDVTWYGLKFVFTPNQAACIKVLWDAWSRGTPWVADGTLLQKAGVGDRQRLRDVFKGHAAWGTMIVQGPQQDLHGLQNPSKKI